MLRNISPGDAMTVFNMRTNSDGNGNELNPNTRKKLKIEI